MKSVKTPVYLDYNSTTPVDATVLEFMLPYFKERFGNAASRTHVFGWEAEEVVKQARERVASLISAEESEIIFTSGSTEAANLAIKGVASAYHKKGKHIVSFATEHKAVLDTCDYLEKTGCEITLLPVEADGRPDLQKVEDAIRTDTILLCAMLANNETGVIHPLPELASLAHAKGALLFTDATQAGGKMQIDVNALHADLLCLSAHKLYGPKGTGALYVRRKNPRVTLIAQMHGGGHERGLRSGTLNVPDIAGFGKACELAKECLADDAMQMNFLRTRLEESLLEAGNVTVNGNLSYRIPNTSSLCFHGIEAMKMIRAIPSIAVATGSACSSALPEPSHVLIAMGKSREEAYSSVRVSVGRYTSAEEVDYAADRIRAFLEENG